MKLLEVFASDNITVEGRLDDGVELGGDDLVELPGDLPKNVKFYKVVNSNITSLVGSPEEVAMNVIILGNPKLTSLVGGPKKVGGFYYCHENNLHNLIGAPERCEVFTAHNNKNLTSLEGAPKRVDGNVKLNMNPKLTSLKGIGTEYLQICGGTLTIGQHISSHALGLVLMNCSKFAMTFAGADIIQRYVGKLDPERRHDAAIDCQHALIEAGFEELAQL